MDIPQILRYLRPGEQWVMHGPDYSSLVWLDVTVKPTLQELQTADASLPATVLVAQRTDAVSLLLTDSSAFAKEMRAILLVILDEINALRQRDRDRSGDVAAAISLADLKTRWAAESTLLDRTPAQGKAAVQNKLSGGLAD